MITEVVHEGIVVKTCTYTDDLFIRIACYRDTDLPSKSLNDIQDAVALAAAAEISQRVFEETGDLQPTSRTWANAQAFASMNNSYLAQYGVHAMVTGISVDASEDTVLVQVSANLERLFPSVVPDVIVTENGFADIRPFTH